MLQRSRIWIPDSPPLAETKVLIDGRFQLELVDVASGEIKQALSFNNIVTDGGLNFFGQNSISNAYEYLQVGTGNTTPTEADVSLAQPIGTRTNRTGSVPVDTNSLIPEYYSRKISRVFNADEANGEIRELGFWNAATGGTLINRALVLDIEGQPTSITKTPSDQLKVVFEYRIYSSEEVSGSMVISSTPVDYVIRPQGTALPNWNKMVTAFGAWNPAAYLHTGSMLFPRTAVNYPSPRIRETTGTVSAYINNSFYRDINFTWDTSVALSDFGLITFDPWYTAADRFTYQMSLSQLFTKTLTNRFKANFRISWGRY
jgi:hypothetical protein